MRDLGRKVSWALLIAASVAMSAALIIMALQYQNVRRILVDQDTQIETMQGELSALHAKQKQDQETISAFEGRVRELEEQLAAAESEKSQLESEAAAAGRSELQPGQILAEPVSPEQLDQFFTRRSIERGDAVFQRIDGRSWRENEDISIEELCYLTLLHYNFDHQVQVGEMVVNTAIADDVISIFEELYLAEYEVQSIRLVDDYWTGDAMSSDANSIEHNNTSCFNYRMSTGNSGNLSKHALGKAIDINPQQNPCLELGGDGVYYGVHENAYPYYDRNSGDPHIIVNSENDICYMAFIRRGFSWGGEWTSPRDYQHFEISE